ncbi:hypothetical protein DSO57_1010900 [Entomophthora muscae]|uniref:Uncharacterized protein n=1 Tax=Entomophthora muscae TaxID=34485 RepID=A0ACC2T6K7_9FUNG|nr:hypothetical protein DSO57_1010900 [Entomophthora muscae]
MTPTNPLSQDKHFEQCKNFVVRCDLCPIHARLPTNPTNAIETMSVIHPSTKEEVPNLTGNITASPFMFYDNTANQKYIVFVFNKLYVRTPGYYKLVFSLYPVKNEEIPTKCSSMAMSDPFTCYLPSLFPGVDASTTLSKDLKDQGVPVTIHEGHTEGDPNQY